MQRKDRAITLDARPAGLRFLRRRALVFRPKKSMAEAQASARAGHD